MLWAIIVVGNTTNEPKEGLFMVRALWQGQVLKMYQIEPRGGPHLFPIAEIIAKEGFAIGTICVVAGYEEERFVMVEIPEEATLEDITFEIVVADNPRVVDLSIQANNAP